MQEMEIVQVLVHLVLLFFVYSCMGWMVEVAYAMIDTGELVNRGFMNGPMCPIYGFGMVALVLLFRAIGTTSVPVVFVIGMIITTTLELVGGWALDKIFHTRWWDYTAYKYNLGGYICLRFTVLWGIGSVIMICVLHPIVDGALWLLPLGVKILLDAFFSGAGTVDLAVSVAVIIGLNRRLEEIDRVRSTIRLVSDRMTQTIGTTALNAEVLLDERKLQMTLAAMEGRENAAELRAQIMDLSGRVRAIQMRAVQESRHSLYGVGRLLRAYPNMRPEKYGESLAAMRRLASSTYARAVEAAAAVREKAEIVAGTVKETTEMAASAVKEKTEIAAAAAMEKAGSAAETVMDRAGVMMDKAEAASGKVADVMIGAMDANLSLPELMDPNQHKDLDFEDLYSDSKTEEKSQ